MISLSAIIASLDKTLWFKMLIKIKFCWATSVCAFEFWFKMIVKIRLFLQEFQQLGWNKKFALFFRKQWVEDTCVLWSCTTLLWISLLAIGGWVLFYIGWLGCDKFNQAKCWPVGVDLMQCSIPTCPPKCPQTMFI